MICRYEVIALLLERSDYKNTNLKRKNMKILYFISQHHYVKYRDFTDCLENR